MSGYDDFRHVGTLKVAMDLAGEIVPVGTLARSAGDGRIYFEYDKDFIDRKLEVSPYQLDLKRGARAPKDEDPFGGLFGLFDDSLPDGRDGASSIGASRPAISNSRQPGRPLIGCPSSAPPAWAR